MNSSKEPHFYTRSNFLETHRGGYVSNPAYEHDTPVSISRSPYSPSVRGAGIYHSIDKVSEIKFNQRSTSKRKLLIAIAAIFILLVIVAVAVALGILLSKDNDDDKVSSETLEMTFQGEGTLTGKTWTPAYLDENSALYKSEQRLFIDKMDDQFLKSGLKDNYQSTVVTGFREGSVVVKFLIRMAPRAGQSTAINTDSIMNVMIFIQGVTSVNIQASLPGSLTSQSAPTITSTTKSPTLTTPTTIAQTLTTPSTKVPTTTPPTTKSPTITKLTTKAPSTMAPTTKVTSIPTPTTKIPSPATPTTKVTSTMTPTTNVTSITTSTTKIPNTTTPTTKTPSATTPTTRIPSATTPTTKMPSKPTSTTKESTTTTSTTKLQTTTATTTVAQTTTTLTTIAPTAITSTTTTTTTEPSTTTTSTGTRTTKTSETTTSSVAPTTASIIPECGTGFTGYFVLFDYKNRYSPQYLDIRAPVSTQLKIELESWGQNFLTQFGVDDEISVFSVTDFGPPKTNSSFTLVTVAVCVESTIDYNNIANLLGIYMSLLQDYVNVGISDIFDVIFRYSYTFNDNLQTVTSPEFASVASILQAKGSNIISSYNLQDTIYTFYVRKFAPAPTTDNTDVTVRIGTKKNSVTAGALRNYLNLGLMIDLELSVISVDQLV